MKTKWVKWWVLFILGTKRQTLTGTIFTTPGDCLFVCLKWYCIQDSLETEQSSDTKTKSRIRHVNTENQMMVTRGKGYKAGMGKMSEVG